MSQRPSHPAPRPGSPSARRAQAAERQARAAERQARTAERAAAAARRSARAARRWRVSPGQPDRRFKVALIAFGLFASLLGARALQVQGLDPSSNAAWAVSEVTREAVTPASRGTLRDRNGELLAVSEPAVNVVANPHTVNTKDLDLSSLGPRARLRLSAGRGLVAGLLTEYLGGSFQTYYDRLAPAKTDEGDDVQYVVLSRQVREYTYVVLDQSVSRLGYAGLQSESAPVRTYPSGSLAANVLGYMVYDSELDQERKYPFTGGGGLEQALDDRLAGTDGKERYEFSSQGRIPAGSTVVTEPVDGISYNLTIDAGLQYEVETRLRQVVDQHKPRSVAAIVMNIKTGEVLAMAAYPTFDPNDLAQADPDNLRNWPVTDAYEPGSVEKVLTFGALLDAGLVTPGSTLEVPGCVFSGGKNICDSDGGHATWQLTATGVMALSSNVGSLLFTRQMDKQVLSDYLKSFGLGSASGLGLPGEGSGEVPEASMSDQTRDQIAFGQGLSLTAIQMASAVGGLVNGGLYVSPTLVKSAVQSDGRAWEIPSQVTRQVISPQASADLLSMMEAVVTVNHYGIEGYRLAGKTGTAERYDETCACYRGYTGSYITVGPVEDPEILTYVVVDDPTQNGYYGSQNAVPAALDIMKVALPRYGVPTSSSEAPDYQIRW
ncbi:MAG: penicillin-binding protein 2 [Propionibacteriaceae bacterium]|jgi:cell division protein FtsI (penicillin-binding protein 3)|nr:penicillin-binding protein 2 [Propionibacteriaceae bacterium]